MIASPGRNGAGLMLPRPPVRRAGEPWLPLPYVLEAGPVGG